MLLLSIVNVLLYSLPKRFITAAVCYLDLGAEDDGGFQQSHIWRSFTVNDERSQRHLCWNKNSK